MPCVTIKAKATANLPRTSFKIAKRGTNKSEWVCDLADTGAQSNIWEWNTFRSLFLTKV